VSEEESRLNDAPPPQEMIEIQITDDFKSILPIRDLPPETRKLPEESIKIEGLAEVVAQAKSAGLLLFQPPAVVKEQTAKWVAYGIVIIFGLLTTMALIGGFLIMRCSGCSPETAKQLVTDGAIPYLKEVGAFAQTVFAPLLAFILGYYFAAQKKGT
jgi:hypothetical protein